MYVDIMDLHTHTIASGHAYNTIYEMARSAADKGLSLLGIADHGPGMPIGVPKNYFNNVRMLPRELYGVKMMFGCEVNILDYAGNIDLESKALGRIDYAVASFHKPCFKAGTIAQNTGAYIGAMANPHVQIIGHPDESDFPVDYETLVCAAKEYRVLLEVNSESFHPRCARKDCRNNYLQMLALCKKYQVPIIIDSDAHCEVDVGNHKRAHEFLNEIDFPETLVVNRSLEAAAEFIPFLKRMLAGELTLMDASM